MEKSWCARGHAIFNGRRLQQTKKDEKEGCHARDSEVERLKIRSKATLVVKRIPPDTAIHEHMAT